MNLLAAIPGNPVDLFHMFWHAILFEVPRVLIAGVVTGVGAMLAGIAHARRRVVHGALHPHNPTVSLLLAGHNEGACLRQAITGLNEQTYTNFEIIVIDDGSTDNMAEIGRQLLVEGRIQTFISTGLRGGKSAAANLGLTYCTGDIVMIADIDTSFDNDALAHIIEPFTDPAVGAVSGNLAVRNPRDSVITRFQAIQYLLSISLGRRFTSMMGLLSIASGAFAAFRREALLAIGGWEVGPGEDADITVKLRMSGWKIRFKPEAWALTDVPDSTLALCRQRLRWNRSLIRVRVRKFRSIFNPLRPNFSLSSAVAHADILLYQGILPFTFYFYLVWVFAVYGVHALNILAFVSLVYVAGSLLSFVMSVAINGHYGDLRLIVYVPGYALFNAYVLRAVSVYSYLDEFFLRKSYEDTYVPARVLDAAEHF